MYSFDPGDGRAGFSACCGSKYSVANKPPTGFFSHNPGIYLWFGKYTPEKVPDTHKFHVVETRNGPVSIAIRVKPTRTQINGS